jgi:uncharacterized protein involved in exopolysaccharide biosynthesis
MSESKMPQEMPYRADNEIDLRELFGIVWAEKWLIVSITALAAVGSVIAALTMTDIYRAEAVLAAADSEQGNSMMSQLGGAAALLGVNVGSGGSDNIDTAIATLRSYQFISRFIEQNDLLVPLFAAKWDKQTQRAVIDGTIYNPETREWQGGEGEPSLMEAFRALSGVLTISGPDLNTGIIRVTIAWHNPQEAASWVNQLVRDLNQEIRSRDVREANNAIAYLQQQLESTQLVDMQRVFYQLIESQTRITMLADVREEYVFRVIDPAVVPDQKSEPRRSLICILGTIAGGVFSLIIVFLRRFVTQFS